MYAWLTRLILIFFPRRSVPQPATQEKSSAICLSAQDEAAHSGNNHSNPNASSPKEAEHLASCLESCMTSLRQTCQTVESDFLDLGERLQSIYSQAVQVAQKVQDAIEYIGLDAENSSLAIITRTTRNALANLDLEQSRMAESMQDVRYMCDHLHHLQHMTGGLKRIAKALKMVAVNINIESCRVCEFKESFSALSQETRTLSHAVSSVVLTLGGEIQAIAQRLESIQKLVIAKMERFAHFSDEARHMADRATPECRGLIDRSVNVLQHVGESSRVISQSTSEIVVNLQIHDNVSQRIAHIVEALSDARRLILQLQDTRHAHDGGLAQIAAIDANFHFQSAQLTDIIADIDRVLHQSGQAFETIDHTVRDISSGIVQVVWNSAMDPYNHTTQSGSIESLKTALEKIRDLIDQGDGTIYELKAIARDAAAAVSRIGDHMKQIREVNFDIHLKSLNAIFKSIHLGNRGRAINVLVQEMKELATLSKELVEQIESVNSAIMNRTAQLQERLGAGSADETNPATTGTGKLNVFIREFSEKCSVFAQFADEVSELSRTLGALIAETGSRLAFLKPFAATLRDHQQSLSECRALLAPWVTAVSGAHVLDQAPLAERYTMQQERDIHTSVLNGAARQEENGAADTSRTEAPAGIDAGDPPLNDKTEELEFGENVVLF
jgi:methyl-accepting chemotaxis protein